MCFLSTLSYILMNKIVSYLSLKNVGVIELLLALTPILSGFRIAGLRFADLMWVILMLVSFLKFKYLPFRNNKPYMLFVLFWTFHELVIMTFFGSQMNIVGMFTFLLSFLSVFVLYPILDIRKLEGALNWVTLISIFGLLYQFQFVIRGIAIHPIEIPGLEIDASRLENLIPRPSSFFMEPAAYAEYMLAPLSIALIRKKYLWAISIILSVFLTTSTTGLITVFIMLFIYILSQSIGTKNKFMVLIAGIGLMVSISQLSLFSSGIEKFETIDVETNVRLAQGPSVLKSMNLGEIIVGTHYSTAYDYCIKADRASDVVVYGDMVYLPTFYYMILRFGIIGFLLYLNIYYRIYRKNNLIAPLIICLMSIMFTSPVALSNTYFFTTIILLSIAYNSNYLKLK